MSALPPTGDLGESGYVGGDEMPTMPRCNKSIRSFATIVAKGGLISKRVKDPAVYLPVPCSAQRARSVMPISSFMI